MTCFVRRRQQMSMWRPLNDDSAFSSDKNYISTLLVISYYQQYSFPIIALINAKMLYRTQW